MVALYAIGRRSWREYLAARSRCDEESGFAANFWIVFAVFVWSRDSPRHDRS